MYFILFVDDEPSLLQLSKLFLERSGDLSVDTSPSAKEALEYLDTHIPDAVVSDYQMPGMDGIAFLKRVRSQFGDVPFILFTGRGREEVAIEALNSGADFYLQKGGDPTSQFVELKHKIRMAVERRKAEEALRQETDFNHAIFDSVPGILYLYDSSGRLVRWNKNHETITGYSGEELAGRHVLDWFPDPADREVVSAGIRRAMEEGQGSAEATLVTRSGVGIPFFFTARRLRIDNQAYFTGIGIDITEKRKTEEALHVSEEMFRGISERSSDLIYMEDRNRVITYVSPSVERILGFMPDEITGKKGESFVLPEDMQKIQERRDIRRKGGKPEILEVRAKRKDGSVAVLDLQAIPVVRNGEFQGFQVIGRDVTERRRAEQLQKESEEIYRTLAENLPEFVIVHCGGTILYANRISAQVTGIRQEDLVGRSIFEFVAPESRDLVVDRMNLRGKGKPTGWNEIGIIPRAGEHRVALVNSIEIPYLGSPAVLVVMSDITAHKDLEASLRESEERFRVLSEQSLDTIMLFDPELRHLYVNPAVEKGLGIPPADFIGKTHAEMGFPEHLVRLWEESLEQVFITNTPLEVEFQIPNGAWVHWLLSPVNGPDGGVAQVLGSARDITKLKMTEETLRRANRQINILNAITRHDILNQITLMQGCIALMKENARGTTWEEEELSQLESATERIRDQIGFTSIYEDIGSSEPRWQDVAAVVGRKPARQGISVITDLGRLEVFADPMLEKVFYNLMDNTARHGGPVDTIRISAETTPDGCTILFQDNGKGIADDQKEKIFERGFGNNTGLGLFLVREILAITGITIRETGKAGSGARFEMLVPPGSYRFAAGTN
jgi:PAS domain S-box-containing protein